MTIARIIAQKLQTNKQTLATAESCTGGLIAHTLTNTSGSSSYFTTGVIAYANTTKTALLGVPARIIERRGAVSQEVAKAMAQGLRKRSGVDYAVSTTGIAGPTGGTTLKPVGLVFIAVSSSQETIVKRFCFKGTRLQVKKQATKTALKILLSSIQPS